MEKAVVMESTGQESYDVVNPVGVEPTKIIL